MKKTITILAIGAVILIIAVSFVPAATALAPPWPRSHRPTTYFPTFYPPDAPDDDEPQPPFVFDPTYMCGMEPEY